MSYDDEEMMPADLKRAFDRARAAVDYEVDIRETVARFKRNGVWDELVQAIDERLEEVQINKAKAASAACPVGRVKRCAGFEENDVSR